MSMVFRAMDAGSGGVDGDDADVECPNPVTAASLYVASTGTRVAGRTGR
jgi:hypothetical protein